MENKVLGYVKRLNGTVLPYIYKDKSGYQVLIGEEKRWIGKQCVKYEIEGPDEKQKDNINPDHYKVGGIETFDFIKAKLSKEALEGYCAGNILKYVTRYGHKNGVEDLKKANWYLGKMIESMERVE